MYGPLLAKMLLTEALGSRAMEAERSKISVDYMYDRYMIHSKQAREAER